MTARKFCAVPRRTDCLFHWDAELDHLGRPVTVDGLAATFTRAGVKYATDANGVLYKVPYGMPAREYISGVYAGIWLEGAATNLALHGRDLSITHQLTVSGGAGTFTNGETVNASGGGSGTYVAAESTSTKFALRGGSGTMTGTLTGASSGATKTIDSSATVWTKTSMTASANSATGPDGTTSATTLTATSGNATIFQAMGALGAASRTFGLRIRRKTGSGAISLTDDNGSNYTTVTVTTSWTRVKVSSSLVISPTIGIKIATSGDAIEVDFAQFETGAFLTSDIPTVTASVARAADALTFSYKGVPQAMTLYVKGRERGTNLTAATNGLVSIGGSTNSSVRILNGGANTYQASHEVGSIVSSTAAAGSALDDLVELRACLAATGTITLGQAINSGTEAVASASSALTLASAFAAQTLYVNQRNGSDGNFIFRSLKLVPDGDATMAECRVAA